MNRLILPLLLPILTACSNEQLYNSAASARQHQCSQMVNRDDRERCEKDANRTYREYEQLKKQ